MKILLVDNSTTYKDFLLKGLEGHEVAIQTYMPGIDFQVEGKDLVILSGGGGEGREANDRMGNGELWYKDELQFILDSKTPILGICMGFELVAQAYGSKVEMLPRRIIGYKEMVLRNRRSAQKRIIKQYKYHNWRIADISSKHFEVKGVSRSGIEMIRHKTRPLIASQFHPEIVGGELALSHLIKALKGTTSCSFDLNMI